ncbi:uncharacterized protein EI90DRAFT_3068691 [Cantharellus anzutake]|uniref:uncharacterized protein n=1 Tax=Cantharellus anzutake TaxID=1750568 RepID=UPI001905ED54|nr:uncharacterized protein EI90DRAFT_3068691 [Cantharellus anzutake]KAF8326971.1 hypothetical protein EI90DRAFT_3068691 [Cantharellus anzutake]
MTGDVHKDRHRHIASTARSKVKGTELDSAHVYAVEDSGRFRYSSFTCNSSILVTCTHATTSLPRLKSTTLSCERRARHPILDLDATPDDGTVVLETDTYKDRSIDGNWYADLKRTQSQIGACPSDAHAHGGAWCCAATSDFNANIRSGGITSLEMRGFPVRMNDRCPQEFYGDLCWNELHRGPEKWSTKIDPPAINLPHNLKFGIIDQPRILLRFSVIQSFCIVLRSRA